VGELEIEEVLMAVVGKIWDVNLGDVAPASAKTPFDPNRGASDGGFCGFRAGGAVREKFDTWAGDVSGSSGLPVP
jgi:hypothetical protein